MGNGVAIGQDPIGILDVEMDETRHVVPAAEVQADDVIAQVIDELLHLVRERV